MGIFGKKKPTPQAEEQSVNSAVKGKKKQGCELSDIAKKYGIRISAPNGYFPEDVDRVLSDLIQDINRLSHENKILGKRASDAVEEKNKINSEYIKLKTQMAVMRVPDTTQAQNENMLNRFREIPHSPNFDLFNNEEEDNPALDVSTDESLQQDDNIGEDNNSISFEPTANINPVFEEQISDDSFDDIISVKKEESHNTDTQSEDVSADSRPATFDFSDIEDI